MACVARHARESESFLMHLDLHETTDSDNDVFIPAKAARDGLELPPWWPIPDGFYIIGDLPRPQLDWHAAMLAAVAETTHIAGPDEKGQIAGEDVSEIPGVLILPSVGDCASHSSVPYSATTEVYPDSSRTNPDECNRAQVACVCAALDFIVARRKKLLAYSVTLPFSNSFNTLKRGGGNLVDYQR